MKQRDYVTVSNVTVMWASTNEPNKRSGKFQMDLCNLSPEDVKALSSLGVKARTKDADLDKGHFITVKSIKPMAILDEDGKPLASDVKIANGSKAKAIIGSYEWSGTYGKGVSPTLLKAKITELKQYIGDVGFDDEDDAKVRSGVGLAEMADDLF